jgi:hypothetical protein
MRNNIPKQLLYRPQIPLKSHRSQVFRLSVWAKGFSGSKRSVANSVKRLSDEAIKSLID